MNWREVSKAHPCPQCGKTHWCSFTPKGDGVLCMRIASDRPIQFKSGEVGYLHNVTGQPVRVTREDKRPAPIINVGKLLQDWFDSGDRDLQELAEILGVSKVSLGRIGVVWSPKYNAWAIPFRDGWNEFTGIQLRWDDGTKRCVPGSHLGCFIPQCEPDRLALICEGCSDTAAALTMGYFAIGRPSCSGGVTHILTAFRRLGVTRAVVVADNDEPGLQGAKMLQEHLPMPSCAVVLPSKDLRAFAEMGGNRELLDSMINSCVWRQP